MTFNKRLIPVLGTIAAMAILILDSKTALNGMAEGIDLCLKVVIPSLFPFLILSAVLTESALGMELRFLLPLCRLCRIPEGAAPLLLVGLIGGYPVGAQCITRACRNGQLSITDGHRMLGFCSNAGPAFIFGITAGLFDSPIAPWILWMIQITAVLITGILLPGGTTDPIAIKQHSGLSPAAVLQQAITAMTSICSWVIVFRTGIVFCDKWLVYAFPQTIQCLIVGILELTNGCCRLANLTSDQIRFLLCSVFLSFGGIGVYMQTLSVTQGLGTGAYLQGKLFQTAIAAVIAWGICPILFPGEKPQSLIQILLPAVAAVIILIKFFQNKKNNSRNMVAQGV